MEDKVFSSEGVSLACDAARAAVQKDAVGRRYMAQRKHMLVFTLPSS